VFARVYLPFNRVWLLVLALILLGAASGCRTTVRQPPPPPVADARFPLGKPVVAARPGANGAPVDCTVDATNRSGQTVARLLVTCELLDRDGFPLGAGFGATYDVPSGESRPIRAVVYGVRDFAAARVAVTSAALDQVGGR